MDPPRTSKGERTKARILHAATTVVGRDGLPGATLRRIAEEAAVDKRNVLYYYGSREVLLVQVVLDVGERIATGVEEGIRPSPDPGELARRTVDAIWTGLTSEPELARAYFALIGGGAGEPAVERALEQLKRTYRRLIERRLGAIRKAAGGAHGPAAEADVLLTMALLRGLLLEWVEAGDRPALTESLIRFEALLGEGVAGEPPGSA